MSYTEADVREYLAAHLEELEPGLTLCAQEQRFTSTDGASGRVDILARDRLGLRVLIELKKSRPTSRQALQELLKYAGILQRSGVRPEDIRLFVVATDWEDLRVAFAAQAPRDPRLEGFQIEVDDAGSITSISKVRPIDLTEAQLRFARPHGMFFWLERADRDARVAVVHEVMSALPELDVAVLVIDHDGSNRAVVTPYAIYIAVAETRGLRIDKLRERIDGALSDPLPNDASGPQETVEQALVDLLWDRFGACDHEHSSPEKLGVELGTWKCVALHRFGPRLGPHLVGTDDDLIQELCSTREGHQHYIKVVSSPGRTLHWANAKRAVLNHVPNWTYWFDWLEEFFADVEATSQEAESVEIRIFLPRNIRQMLFLASYGYKEAVPRLEVTLLGPRPRYAVGCLEWNGVDVENTTGRYGPLVGFSSEEDWRAFLRDHGLSFDVVDRGEPVFDFAQGLLDLLQDSPDYMQHLRTSSGIIGIGIQDRWSKQSSTDADPDGSLF